MIAIARLKLLLDESTETELVKRSNYIGASLSSIVLLHLVLYHDSVTINRKDFNSIQNIETRSLQLDVKDYVIEKYDEKPRYNNSIYLFLSVYLGKVVRKTKGEWEGFHSVEKQGMNFSTYSIEDYVIEKMKRFKEETGLTYTALINYAALIKTDKQLSLFDNGISKTKQGFQLTDVVLDRVEKESKSLKVSAGNLLENKLEKLLISLDI